MKVGIVNTNQYSNTFLSTKPAKINEENQRKNNVKKIIGGVGVAGLAFFVAGILSKSNFAKNIAAKGLDIKDDILIKKETGEAFSGKIKSNIGKYIGFNRVETVVFEKGVIIEKTYKNMLGQEKYGSFYKEGKECLDVFINHQNIVTKKKRLSTTWRNESNTTCIETDGFHKGSVFEWARKLVKEAGWFDPSKL